MQTEKTAYNKFSIDDFRPEGFHLLGEGVWGRVYDLADGTVLKLAKETSSGIGSGRKKIEREYAALKALADVPEINNFLPRVLGKGDVSPGSELTENGFSLWLRSTKKEGESLSDLAIEALPSEEKERLGHNIGMALARLHAAMASIPNGQYMNPDSLYDELKQDVSDNPFYMACIAILEKELALIPPDILNRAAHNDYNISNLLFSGYEVCAVLDFAEWGPCFPEKDISDIVKDCPSLIEPLVAAYEQESMSKIDRRRVALGLAENALYGVVISERKSDMKERKSEMKTLFRHFEELGYNISEQSPISVVKAFSL